MIYRKCDLIWQDLFDDDNNDGNGGGDGDNDIKLVKRQIETIFNYF